MRRQGLALLLLAIAALGTWAALSWPSNAKALDCPPSQQHLDDAGIARCGPGEKLSASQVLTAGGKLDLNAATADDLAVISGIGPVLAKAIVDERARLGHFSSWEQLDAVAGIGPAKLAALQDAAEIR